MNRSATGGHELDALKGKYRSVLRLIEQRKVRLQNLHLQDGKLVLRGTAPSDEVKDEVWDEIKLVDPSFHDLAADLTVDPSASAHPAETSRTYTVQKGDSLWRIAERFLGDGRELDRIVRANPDKLEGADSVIHPGDVLRIPS